MIAPQNVNVLYTGEKAYINALTEVREGATAYATDTDEFGTYNGTVWTWGTGIPDVPIDGITYGRINQTWVDLDTIYMQNDGWTPVTDAWTFASADAPVYQIYVAGDITTSQYYQAGYKVRFVQSATIKYGIVVKIGSYDAGNNRTPVDVYCGTDYTIANAAISNTDISLVKAPQGFPLDPIKWTVVVTSSINASQANPSASTWYNVSGTYMDIPIGSWLVIKDCLGFIQASPVASTSYSIRTTFSTSNNSESDNEFQSTDISTMPAGTNLQNFASQFKEKYLSLTTKTRYYLNILTGTAGASSLSVRGDITKTILRAVCTYI